MTHLLVAHAPEEEARAALLAAKLGALGYEVRQEADIYRALSPFERRRLQADIDKAACVVVLWSRDGADGPALRAAVDRAKASGKLALARMDSSPPPVGHSAVADLTHWIGRDQTRAWRALVAAIGSAAKAPIKRLSSAAAPAAQRAPQPRAAAPQRAASAPSVAAETPEKRKSGGLGIVLTVLTLLAAAGGAAYYIVTYRPFG
ncbi:MAG: hypothetical protein WDM79_07640 [Terricaulis sp.]